MSKFTTFENKLKKIGVKIKYTKKYVILETYEETYKISIEPKIDKKFLGVQYEMIYKKIIKELNLEIYVLKQLIKYHDKHGDDLEEIKFYKNKLEKLTKLKGE